MASKLRLVAALWWGFLTFSLGYAFSATCTRQSRFRPSSQSSSSSSSSSSSLNAEKNQEYRNAATEILSNFMQSPDKNKEGATLPSPLEDIDFKAPKQPVTNLNLLAAILDYELSQKEWFVTGLVNPVYFAEDFCFQDPDVTLQGIEAYAKGVNTLFDQATSRAEIMETVVNPELGENVITCTWRLSGKANIGPGLTIKPYIVYTDFTVENGLIVRQEDRFSLPQWDILLSSLFPFLIGKLTKPPAPPVEPRVVPKPGTRSTGPGPNASPLAALANLFSGHQ